MFNKTVDKLHKYTGRLKPRVTPNMLRLPETGTSIPMPECKPPRDINVKLAIELAEGMRAAGKNAVIEMHADGMTIIKTM